MYGYPVTPPKPRIKSKVYRFNTLAAALIAAELHLNVLQSVLGPKTFAITSFVLIVVNVILREFTDQPVGGSKS